MQMELASETFMLHLKDNHINDKRQIEKILPEDAVTLRYLSSHSLSEMKNDKACDIHIVPHYITATNYEIGDAYE